MDAVGRHRLAGLDAMTDLEMGTEMTQKQGSCLVTIGKPTAELLSPSHSLSAPSRLNAFRLPRGEGGGKAKAHEGAGCNIKHRDYIYRLVTSSLLRS